MSGKKKRILHRYDSRKMRWLHAVRSFLILLVAVFFIFRFVIGFSFVNGISMQNTLLNGDLVIYTRLNSSIKRGDIVSIALPSGEFYVKRVVAVAGDTVDLRDGTVFINDIAETGDYWVGTTLPEEGTFVYPYTVNNGDIFVLGDNREGSIDSRYYGVFNLRQVTGILRIKLGWLYAELL